MLPTQSVGPFVLPAFAQISIEQWSQHLEVSLAEAEEALASLAVPGQSPDFEHSFLGLEKLSRDLSEATQLFFVSMAPHSTPEKSTLGEKWAERLSEFGSSVYLSDELYARCLRVSEEWANAPEAERRLMDHHLRAFKAAGQGLSAADRSRLSSINGELARLGLEFQNLCMAAGAVVVGLPESAAEGLPAQDVEAARDRAAKAGISGLGFVLQPMQVESWIASMHDRACRQQLWQACAERGMGIRDTDARPHVRRILELRTERSRLLGYPTPAHCLMENTMAATPARAMELVKDTWEKLGPGLEADLNALRQLAAEDGVARLQPWDVGYYTAAYRRRHFSFNESTLRNYLPLSVVRQGAFDAASRLFGLRFEPVSAELYHPDTQAYLVFKNGQAEASGLLVVDDYLRETKAPGAWMDNLQPSSNLDVERFPMVVNVCNFQPPAATTPTLLEMDDAVTVFHELGHALHALLSTARYPSQAGTNVAQDFVELPSQILENWFREPSALQSIARHWETGERLSDAQIAALVESQKFGQGLFLAQYLSSAYLDLVVHDRPSPPDEDLAQFQADVLAGLDLPEGIAPRHGLLHFSHLFTGDSYASGYYSYLWAEVLEADAFTHFRAHGLFSEEWGQRLREAIFEPGGSADPSSLFESFMGRAPSPQALLAKHGLLPAVAPFVRSPAAM